MSEGSLPRRPGQGVGGFSGPHGYQNSHTIGRSDSLLPLSPGSNIHSRHAGQHRDSKMQCSLHRMLHRAFSRVYLPAVNFPHLRGSSGDGPGMVLATIEHRALEVLLHTEEELRARRGDSLRRAIVEVCDHLAHAARRPQPCATSGFLPFLRRMPVAWSFAASFLSSPLRLI